uniref:MFS-type transporter SLC18B1 n=1 Tax=Mus musculus TaxID=10090 RepID=S18B1_MOUSE|nr:RecName: Full=MFS-type transporter SLC18B1; AltName: Full=Solute carrier family 18 member B1; AltName: Full=Vesicular polyamine transporter; Short=VPAT [Mus musculus]
MDEAGSPAPAGTGGGDDPGGSTRETSRRLSREQIFVLVSAASMNLGCMMTYSILGPFFPKEAEKKGASNTMIGMIFGCYALFELLASLVFGKYLVHIGAKFMFIAGMFVSGGVTILFGVLDQLPEGPIFIAMCFLVRIVDAIGFGAAITASSSILAKAFPNNVATVMGSLEVFSGLGLVAGPPLGGLLYQSFGYEVPFIFLGCIVLLMIPLNLYILPSYAQESDPGKQSFWKLVTLPKMGLLAFVIISLSSCFGFLDPTLSLFVMEKFSLSTGYVGLVFLGLSLSYAISSPLFGLLSDKMPTLRKWLLVFGNLITAGCYMLLGPVPLLHIKSQLWLLVLVLVVNGISAGMSIIPTFPEMLSCAYANGFEDSISTLGLVSGLFGAMWSVGAFMGPILGGFLCEKIGFEWAAAMQGLWTLLSGVSMALFYLWEDSTARRRSKAQNSLGTEEERAALLPNDT